MARAAWRQGLIAPSVNTDHVARVAGAPEWLSLWLADLDAGPGSDANLVSIEDRERAARFRFERDRRRFVASRLTLRRLLGDEAPNMRLEPFEYGAHGKPRLGSSGGLKFNLSHSENWMLVGLAEEHELGVDVEIIRSISDMRGLARRHFTEREQSELSVCGRGTAVESFLRGWTRKEACLKALGTGLILEAVAVDAGLSPDERLILIATESWEADVRVVSVDLGSCLIGAVARVESVRH